jgi:cysteine desulfurase
VIYLDHNATTPLHPEVRAAMAPFLDDGFGNPSSAHEQGRRARAAVEESRRAVAARIGVRPSEIVFTSGGTESNNLAILGTVGGPGAHVVVSPIEHSSVLEPAAELARRGAEVTFLAVDGEGRVRAADVAAAIGPRTALVSVGWANNEIGTVQPVAEIAAVCRARGVRLHVDAVQAFGKIPLDGAPFDLCSLSAHKIGGPKGVGALAVRPGVSLRPLVFGGKQERGLRAGTENVAAIVGFGAAATLARPDEGVAARRELLWRGLEALGGARRHGPRHGCLPNTLNVAFAGARGETLVAALDLEGVAVSVGSACAAGSAEPSHVLQAIGLDRAASGDGIRFSLGAGTTEEEIEHAVAIVKRVVGRIRALGVGGEVIGDRLSVTGRAKP